ncbi:MAG: hypothetical protein JW717_12550 [Marinilabiliaceae bacterium]|nr:hypothetical protein [Marinilabiliaceae bacterium]
MKKVRFLILGCAIILAAVTYVRSSSSLINNNLSLTMLKASAGYPDEYPELKYDCTSSSSTSTGVGWCYYDIPYPVPIQTVTYFASIDCVIDDEGSYDSNQDCDYSCTYDDCPDIGHNSSDDVDYEACTL